MVQLPIYGYSFPVVYGDKELAIEFSRTFVEDGAYFDDSILRDTHGYFIGFNDGCGVCYLGDSIKNYNTIVHELTHAILFMSKNLGIHIGGEDESQETSAYLFGYVIGFVLDTKKDEWYPYDRKNKVFKEKRIKFNVDKKK